MQSLYQRDLAYVHAAAFETIARGAAGEIVRRLQNCRTPVRRVMDVGCGAEPLTEALLDAGFDVTGIDTSSGLHSDRFPSEGRRIPVTMPTSGSTQARPEQSGG